MLLSTAYLPPVSYFQKIAPVEKVSIEKHEHFIKQTYRNRCEILGANGVQMLSVPLVNTHEKTLITGKRSHTNKTGSTSIGEVLKALTGTLLTLFITPTG